MGSSIAPFADRSVYSSSGAVSFSRILRFLRVNASSMVVLLPEGLVLERDFEIRPFLAMTVGIVE